MQSPLLAYVLTMTDAAWLHGIADVLDCCSGKYLKFIQQHLVFDMAACLLSTALDLMLKLI